MRRILPALLGVSLLLLLPACGGEDTSQEESSSTKSSAPAAQAGKVQDVDPEPVPDLTLETMKGESINLAEQDGRVLLVNFWATWCAPCREEIPDLKALHADLNSDGLTVIGVALDRDGAEVVKPYVENHKINYPIVLDGEGTTEAELGPIYGLPTTLVVNPQGQIVKRVVGILPVEEMKPTFEDMLENASTSGGST